LPAVLPASKCIRNRSAGGGFRYAADVSIGSGFSMAQDGTPVVYKVRVFKDLFTCRGYLVWEGGVVYAIGESCDDDAIFPPDKVALEESDLELKTDDDGREWYLYHGFVMAPGYF
jgi:hypothetical protein